MSTKKTQKWETMKSQGKTAFVVKYGVIGWGIPTAIGWCAVTAWKESVSTLYGTVPFALIAFPAGGILFGMLMWRFNDWMYSRKADAV